MFQNRIRAHYPSFTPGFRKLADYILENTLDAAFLSSRELAERAGVEVTTIDGFCQEIAYSNYEELTEEIKSYIRDRVTIMHSEANGRTDEIEIELLEALKKHFLTTFSETFATQKAALVKAVKFLRNAQRIWITGEFTSYTIAQFLEKNFTTAGISTSTFHANPIESASAIAQMEQGDTLLAIALGHPGLETGYAVKIARAKGISTICFCNSDKILPAGEAELVITVPTQSPINIASFDTSLILLSMLVEATVTAKINVDKTVEVFNAIQQAMGDLLGMRAQTESYDIAL